MTRAPRRFVALAGKIAPTTRERFETADSGGTVEPAHGSAEEARDVNERDRPSHSPGEHELASEVSERIRAIISSAEAAANAVRHEAEQRAQTKRRAAEEEAQRILQDARADAEALLAERVRRISELSDTVVERAEGIVMRLDRAEEVRRQLQELADALGESAERLARELGAAEGRVPQSRQDEPLDLAGQLLGVGVEEDPRAVAADDDAVTGDVARVPLHLDFVQPADEILGRVVSLERHGKAPVVGHGGIVTGPREPHRPTRCSAGA